MAELPNHSNLRIAQLSVIFKKTTNSYKFYWFLSLLQHAEQSRTISFRDVIIDMVALSWHTVAYFKLSLGSADQLPEIIQRLLATGDLNSHSKTKEVGDYLQACWNTSTPSDTQKELLKALKNLENYVPYRFISPKSGHRITSKESLLAKRPKF